MVTTHGYYVGTTGRAITGAVTGPLRHAIPATLPMASRTGRNYRAVCGASVRNVDTARVFDNGHDRACRRCAAIVPWA